MSSIFHDALGPQFDHLHPKMQWRFGFCKLFGYRGSFTVTERPCTRDEIPVDVLPIREERRE